MKRLTDEFLFKPHNTACQIVENHPPCERKPKYLHLILRIYILYA